MTAGRRFRSLALFMFLLALVALLGCSGTQVSSSTPEHTEPYVLPAVVAGTAPANPYSLEQIMRGRMLVDFGGCHDCHTPWAFNASLGGPAPDRTRLFMGHPEGAPDPQGKAGPHDLLLMGPTATSFSMPFGVVYSPNLTPDIDTGIGTWTEEMFVKIFRKATHMGGSGRPVLPPMPWPNAATLPDEDLVAIFAYLRSLPPIRNGVQTLNPPDEVMAGIDRSNQAVLKIVQTIR